MEYTSQKHQQVQGFQSFLNLRRGYIEKYQKNGLVLTNTRVLATLIEK